MELRPSLQELFETVRQVCENVMAIAEGLPRLALLGTSRQLRELEVSCSATWEPVLSFALMMTVRRKQVAYNSLCGVQCAL